MDWDTFICLAWYHLLEQKYNLKWNFKINSRRGGPGNWQDKLLGRPSGGILCWGTIHGYINASEREPVEAPKSTELILWGLHRYLTFFQMDGKARANRPGLLSLRPEAITGTEEDTVAWMQGRFCCFKPTPPCGCHGYRGRKDGGIQGR